MPYLLRQQGVSVDRIAGVVALASIPNIWYFLYSPVVDLGLRRRTWILLVSAGGALFSSIAAWLSGGSLAMVTALLFASSAVVNLTSSANGSLLTTLDPGVRGRASGWYNAGNLGGGAIGGGITIWIASHASLSVLAASIAAFGFLPALAALGIVENPHSHQAAGILFTNLLQDLKQALWSRKTLAGLAFFLSPVGSAAVQNLGSGVGPDYHASATEVLFVTGIGGGLLCAFGSLAGGFVCDRMNRMRAYVTGGALSAGFAFYLSYGGFTPATFAAGYSLYSIAAGFSYAAFTALVLDVLGAREHAAGTSYSLLSASGNVPIVYMTSLDGLGYKYAGARGLMNVDGIANLGTAMILFVFSFYAARFWRKPQNRVQPAG